MLPQCLPSETMKKKLCANMVPQGAQGYSAEWTKPSFPPMRVFVWLSKPGQTNVWVGDSSSSLPNVSHGAEWSCCPNKAAKLFFYQKLSRSQRRVRSWAQTSFCHAVCIKEKFNCCWEEGYADSGFLHFIQIESWGCQKAITVFCSAKESGHLLRPFSR